MLLSMKPRKTDKIYGGIFSVLPLNYPALEVAGSGFEPESLSG
jgi:hypothetical protein